MTGQRFRILLIAITFLGLVLRVLWLPSQPVSDDDYSVGLSAINYVENGQLGPTMWNHPALRSILVYYSMKIFGSGLIGLKGWSVLFGTLSIALVALVSLKVVESREVSLIAALLWALDPVAINFSRQAINDIYLAFFPLAGMWFAFKFNERGKSMFLIASGIFFGLGIGSKWSALLQLAPTGTFILYHTVRNNNDGRSALPRKIFFLFATLVVLPLTIYLATFYPWFDRGYSLKDWPSLQKSMFIETSTHTGYTADRTAPYRIGDHKAYEWFIMPVSHLDIFYVGRDEGQPLQEPTIENNVVMFLSYSNPLVWLLVLPGVIFTFYRGAIIKDERLLYLTAIFIVSYLPLLLTQRPIWVNTAVYVVPYGIMAAAYMVWNIVPERLNRKRVIAGYLLAVSLLTVPLYLPAIGKGSDVPVMREYLIKKYGAEWEGKYQPHSESEPGPTSDGKGQ